MKKASKVNRKILIGHLQDFLREPNHFARTKLIELDMPHLQLTSLVYSILSDQPIYGKIYGNSADIKKMAAIYYNTTVRAYANTLAPSYTLQSIKQLNSILRCAQIQFDNKRYLEPCVIALITTSSKGNNKQDVQCIHCLCDLATQMQRSKQMQQRAVSTIIHQVIIKADINLNNVQRHVLNSFAMCVASLETQLFRISGSFNHHLGSCQHKCFLKDSLTLLAEYCKSYRDYMDRLQDLPNILQYLLIVTRLNSTLFQFIEVKAKSGICSLTVKIIEDMRIRHYEAYAITIRLVRFNCGKQPGRERQLRECLLTIVRQFDTVMNVIQDDLKSLLNSKLEDTIYEHQPLICAMLRVIIELIQVVDLDQMFLIRLNEIVGEIALPGMEFKPYQVQSFYENQNLLHQYLTSFNEFSRSKSMIQSTATDFQDISRLCAVLQFHINQTFQYRSFYVVYEKIIEQMKPTQKHQMHCKEQQDVNTTVSLLDNNPKNKLTQRSLYGHVRNQPSLQRYLLALIIMLAQIQVHKKQCVLISELLHDIINLTSHPIDKCLLYYLVYMLTSVSNEIKEISKECLRDSIVLQENYEMTELFTYNLMELHIKHDMPGQIWPILMENISNPNRKGIFTFMTNYYLTGNIPKLTLVNIVRRMKERVKRELHNQKQSFSGQDIYPFLIFVSEVSKHEDNLRVRQEIVEVFELLYSPKIQYIGEVLELFAYFTNPKYPDFGGRCLTYIPQLTMLLNDSYCRPQHSQMIVMNLAKLACQNHFKSLTDKDTLFEMLIDVIMQASQIDNSFCVMEAYLLVHLFLEDLSFMPKYDQAQLLRSFVNISKEKLLTHTTGCLKNMSDVINMMVNQPIHSENLHQTEKQLSLMNHKFNIAKSLDLIIRSILYNTINDQNLLGLLEFAIDCALSYEQGSVGQPSNVSGSQRCLSESEYQAKEFALMPIIAIDVILIVTRERCEIHQKLHMLEIILKGNKMAQLQDIYQKKQLGQKVLLLSTRASNK